MVNSNTIRVKQRVENYRDRILRKGETNAAKIYNLFTYTQQSPLSFGIYFVNIHVAMTALCGGRYDKKKVYAIRLNYGGIMV
jgi:hypothetical protein